jgi:hypothetical protein
MRVGKLLIFSCKFLAMGSSLKEFLDSSIIHQTGGEQLNSQVLAGGKINAAKPGILRCDLQVQDKRNESLV